MVPSIIVALKRMGASKIFLYNRTISKAESLKKSFSDIEIIEKENIPHDVDMLINASSLGIHKDDNIKLNYEKIGKNKFFMTLYTTLLKQIFLKRQKNREIKLKMEKKCSFIRHIKHLRYGTMYYQKLMRKLKVYLIHND